MAGVSPTQNSLAALRGWGYDCWIVEYWSSFSRKRVDLFGCIDILAIRQGETLAVQTTTTGVASRVAKIKASEHYPNMLAAGWRVEVHGWTKKPQAKGSKRLVWKQRVVDLSA